MDRNVQIQQHLIFVLQEEDLDSQMGVIDFSLYLRNTGAEMSPEDSQEQTDMTTVLDQKNYIEELNRHLKCVSPLSQYSTLSLSFFFSSDTFLFPIFVCGSSANTSLSYTALGTQFFLCVDLQN